MADYRYSSRALTRDYVLSGVGVAPMGLALAALDTGTVVTTILAGLALLFLGYGVRTGLRHASRIRMDEERIMSLGPVSRAIMWRDLASLSLSYYSTRREGGDGWMELTLKGPSGALRIESTLESFAEVVDRAAREASSRSLRLSPETTSNLKALGIGVIEREHPTETNV